MSGRVRRSDGRPDCGLCGCVSETRKPYPCPCGGAHVICLGCGFRDPDLLLTLEGETLSVCPLSDEYRVARELMGRD